MIERQNHVVQLTNEQLLDRIASAQDRLHNKLIQADIRSSNISDYNKSYLANYLAQAKGILQIYGRLLYHSLKNNQPPQNFVFVDYGGGSGLMSLLAVEVGIGTVIYNDIYDISCADAGHLSKLIGIPLTHIVHGDVDDLIVYLQKNSIAVNAISSFDVLEHIYDVKSHFKKLRALAHKGFRIVYASSANIENPRYGRSVKKKQLEAEYVNREKVVGSKERDTLRAYLDVRKEMIASYAPELTTEQVEKLARSTRGLIQQDIEKSVDEFRRQGAISYHIDHPTNTCDPYTGNWCEHLMDFAWLEQILEREGFSAEVMAGLYHTDSSLPKKLVKVPLNGLIQFLGRQVMFIAPYYILYAEFTA